MSDSLPCPKCGTEARFKAISVIDVDDQPDWRDAIIERTLNQKACKNCGTRFRKQPTFAYFDRSHDLWIGAYPWDDRAHWRDFDAQARSLFDVYYNVDTSMAARMHEAPLRRRVTFGWEALREKIVAASHGLDDVTLELLKRELSQQTSSCATGDSDLRLLEADHAELAFGCVVPSTDAIMEQISCTRAQYGRIADNEAGLRALREELLREVYVDLRRLREMNPN